MYENDYGRWKITRATTLETVPHSVGKNKNNNNKTLVVKNKKNNKTKTTKNLKMQKNTSLLVSQVALGLPCIFSAQPKN